jgi:hypothetical protein
VTPLLTAQITAPPQLKGRVFPTGNAPAHPASQGNPVRKEDVRIIAMVTESAETAVSVSALKTFTQVTAR